MKIVSDYTSMDRLFALQDDMPNAEAVAKLNAALEKTFIAVTADVHVDTGSLKQSGKSSGKRIKARKRWEGTIRFGGPSTGVNNPVDYAIYEKRRGGHHDFFAGLPAMKSSYVKAIKDSLT